MSRKLRFASLIRVSTEKQAKKGESLKTQETQLAQAVERLGGVITKRYAGQEHGTAGWEREQLNQLLADAAKKVKPFDAVIVADPSRWSRDNIASESGLERLRDNGIRFFVSTQEYDLFNDNDRLYLSLQATFNAYQARVQVRKSLESRIHRTRNGGLATGSIPYGRKYDKDTRKWTVDEDAKALMQQIAERYIAGESLRQLALRYGIKETTLWDRLQKCGGTLPVEFRSESLNIQEAFPVKIPPLLDDATIEAMRRRADANKTFTHGHLKHKYLFSRMVFCARCGSALSGQTNFGQRYYRHLPEKRGCGFKGQPRADDLEEVVIRHLFETFGNPTAVQRAIEAATPNTAKVDEYRSRIERLMKQKDKFARGRERILGLVANDTISDEQAKKQLDQIKASETELDNELNGLHEAIDGLPSPESIKAIAAAVADVTAKKLKARPMMGAALVARRRRANRAFDEMTWEEKRALAEMVFSGKTPEGKRMGIYIDRAEGQGKRWTYKLHGQLVTNEGYFFPMDADRMDALFSFGAAAKQGDLLKSASSVTKPGPSAPIRRRRCCLGGRSRRRGDG